MPRNPATGRAASSAGEDDQAQVPGHLELEPVLRNIEERVFAGTTFFVQEATLVIQDEIAEPRTQIGSDQFIHAIAQGCQLECGSKPSAT